MVWLPVVVLAPPLAAVTLFYVPAALLLVVERDDLGAAFDVRAIGARVGAATGPYVLAFVVAALAEVVAQAGLLLCCVGIVLTRFMAHCVAVHAFATAFRAPEPPERSHEPGA
jgi:hypothetical protein